MLYSLSQIRQQVCQMAGIKDTNDNYDLDSTTYPTLTFGNQMINDTIREISSGWDYQFLETSKSYPFQHIISGVQAVDLYNLNSSGVAVASGSITPYPSDVLNYSWLANNSITDINSNFSGISYVGLSGSTAFTGISHSGNQTVHNWTGVGYTYQLDEDIDKFLAPGIVLAHSNGNNTAAGIILANAPYEDVVRMIPIGVISASGTPTCFFELPGLSPTNNKVVQFFPTPLAAYSGSNFIVNYKKKHVDLTGDNAIQAVIPEQWQNTVVQGMLEKVYAIRNPDRQEEPLMRKEKLINSMKLWDAQQPSKMAHWRDASRNTNASFMYDNSTWLTLSDGPGR